MSKRETWSGAGIFFLAGVISLFVVLPLGFAFIFLSLVLGLHALDV